MSFLQRLTGSVSGQKVGTDRFGNTYYEGREPKPGSAYPRRWVVFAKGRGREATAVPPEWHGWLHHTFDALPETKRHPWQKEHQPNLTGTAQSYRPPGHDYAGGRRRPTAGDYEAWTPDT